MPRWRPLSDTERARFTRRAAQPKMDLSAYYDMLNDMPEEEYVAFELEPEDDQRTTKRRFTTAAKVPGLRTVYKPNKDDERTLYVKVTREEIKRRGPRKPKDAVTELVDDDIA